MSFDNDIIGGRYHGDNINQYVVMMNIIVGDSIIDGE